jgi:hypothetical protein
VKSAEKAEVRGPKLDSDVMKWEEKGSKMSQVAGDASSKTGGNLDQVILDLKWVTVVLYWKQYKVADTRYRGLVGTGHQGKGPGSTVLKEVLSGNSG